MNERHDKGRASLREDLARRYAELAKRDGNMSIQIHAVAFGIATAMIGIGGTIIGLPV